jgi:hypothetical protein
MTDESPVVESVVFRVALDGLLVEIFRDFEPEAVGKVGRGIFHWLLAGAWEQSCLLRKGLFFLVPSVCGLLKLEQVR